MTCPVLSPRVNLTPAEKGTGGPSVPRSVTTRPTSLVVSVPIVASAGGAAAASTCTSSVSSGISSSSPRYWEISPCACTSAPTFSAAGSGSPS